MSISNVSGVEKPTVLIVGAGPGGLLAYDRLRDLDVNLKMVEWRPEASVDKRFQVLFLQDDAIASFPKPVYDYLYNKESPKALQSPSNGAISFVHSAVRIQDLVRGYLSHLNAPVERGLRLVDVEKDAENTLTAIFEKDNGGRVRQRYDQLLLTCGYQGIRQLPEPLKAKLGIEEDFGSEHPSIIAELESPSVKTPLATYYAHHNPEGMIGNLLGCPDGVLYLFSSIPEGREQEVRAKPRAFVNELRDLYRPTLDDARITKLQVFEAKVGRIKTFQSPPFRAVIYGDAAGVGLFWRGLGYNMCVKTVGAMRQAVAGLVQGEDPEKVLNHYQKRCDRIMDKWDFFHVPRQWLCYKDMLKNPYLVRVPYVIWNSLPERYSISVRSLVKAERGIHQACQRIAEWVPSWNLTAEKVRSSLPEWPEIFSQPS